MASTTTERGEITSVRFSLQTWSILVGLLVTSLGGLWFVGSLSFASQTDFSQHVLVASENTNNLRTELKTLNDELVKIRQGQDQIICVMDRNSRWVGDRCRPANQFTPPKNGNTSTLEP